jgi:hypothetical protein
MRSVSLMDEAAATEMAEITLSRLEIGGAGRRKGGDGAGRSTEWSLSTV